MTGVLVPALLIAELWGVHLSVRMLPFVMPLRIQRSPAALVAHRVAQTDLASRNSSSAPAPQWIRPPAACPTELEQLMPLLLNDLPSYANRVSQRAYTDYRNSEVPGYVLLAGRPEYEPLPLPTGEYSSAIDPAESNPEVLQVFFTTLERQYLSGGAFQLQHYHWLFLTRTENGWRFVLMLSSVGDATADQPPTPPRDSSQGVIAQAIRLWLRDCEAESIAQ